MKINFSKILEINNLTVTYSSNQSPVLKNLELEVNKGDHLALIGPSGCGKTTLAKSIVNMLPKNSICTGEIFVMGENCKVMNKEQLQNFRRENFKRNDIIKQMLIQKFECGMAIFISPFLLVI